jgi:peroxiredoxin
MLALLAVLAVPPAALAQTATASQAAAATRGSRPTVAAGTRAPDDTGVVVAPSSGAGAMTHGPWVPGTLMTPLKAGAMLPAGSIVQTLDGKPFSLNAAAAGKPTVLIFYRGGWCPYCNAHLRDLQGSEPALRAMGYQILAISADPPEKLRQTMTDDSLTYTLLSDASLQVAARFGLKYKANAEFIDALRKGHNTDLLTQNGGYLLTPAAFVLDRQGTIRFAYANPNFTVRVGQDVLRKAARDALSPAE